MPPPSYRGCWHGVSRGFFFESCHNRVLDERALQAALPFLANATFFTHSRDIAGSGFRPLSDIPHCCLPTESGPCLSPSVADRPKRSAKHLRLGQPLPNQLPNTTQAHQTALFSFIEKQQASKQASKQAAKLLSFLWDSAQTVWQIPTRYAPVRHFVFNCSIDENNVRLACVKHIASVHSEPGSNSVFWSISAIRGRLMNSCAIFEFWCDSWLEKATPQLVSSP